MLGKEQLDGNNISEKVFSFTSDSILAIKIHSPFTLSPLGKGQKVIKQDKMPLFTYFCYIHNLFVVLN